MSSEPNRGTSNRRHVQHQPRERTWRRWPWRWPALAVANLIGLGALLLVIEGASRLLGHQPSVDPATGKIWTFDGTRGWIHVPGAAAPTCVGGATGPLARINGLGLRGPEVSLSRPPRTRRVLVFGDSFVFGVGVPEEQLFSGHLERLLSHSGAVQVLNFGVAGYSTDQEYLLFRDLGVRLGPDLVILVMCDNDFLANTEDFAYRRYYKPFFEEGPGGTLLLRNVPVPRLSWLQRGKLWLSQHSAMWELFRSRSSRNRLLRGSLGLFQLAVPKRSAEEPVSITFALVSEFHSLARRIGAGFLVLNTGHRGEKTPLYHALRPKLDAAGIPYLGLEAALERARRIDPERAWDFDDDTHWNSDAHKLAANVVYTHMRRTSLLARLFGGRG